MKSMLKKLFQTILIISCVWLPSISFAADEASIELSPRNPKPYTPVQATLVSYIFNVNTALITWTVDGKEVLKGVGEKKLKIQTSSVGTKIPVHVTAVTADNMATEIDFVITPESVSILYETPESYTPLFYEGHSLPGEGSLVKFVAIPNISEDGARLNPSSLSYSWYINNELVDNASGIGKQSAMLPLDILSTFTTIKVMVFGPKGATAEHSVDVYPHAVMPLTYSYDEILGVNYTKELGKRFETTKDFIIALEPFYLSTNGQVGGQSSYSWTLDGLPITPLGGKILSMKPKENSYGSRFLSIEVSNKKRPLQKTSTRIGLIFDTRK